MLKPKQLAELNRFAYALVQGGYPEEDLRKRVFNSVKLCLTDASKKDITICVEGICDLALSFKEDVSWAREVKEWVSASSGYFSLQQCYHDLHAINAEDKTAVRVSISRLVKKGELEKDEKTNGKYRKVDNSMEQIKWWEASDECVPIYLPFDLDEKVYVPHKAIIVVAGVSNQGKSGFTLELAEKNCDNFPVRYCASEWSPSNLKRRLKKFDFNEEKARKIEFISRSRNFADVIDPNGLNIIDFLEIHDDAWKVSGQIEAIFDKLSEGIAVVLLQKSPGSPFGKGGHGTIEKACLAVTLDNKILQIGKLKDPIDDEANIDKLGCHYEFGKGGRLIKASQWGEVVKESKGGKEEVTIEVKSWANRKANKNEFSWEG
jgi:hypothetical protein